MKRFKVALRRTHDRAVLPSRALEGDVGYDLCSVQHGRIDPGETVAIDTGWQFAGGSTVRHQKHSCDYIDGKANEFFVKVEARSGLALKSVFPVGGIIDLGYRGQLNVLLYNGRYDKPYDVCVGDRIGQLVFYRISGDDRPEWETAFTETDREPEPTARGSSGFGSTGQ